MEMTILLFQRLSGGEFAAPYNSLQGTGPGFAWFVAAVFLFLIGGTAKAFWDDRHKRQWNGRVVKMHGKKRKSADSERS